MKNKMLGIIVAFLISFSFVNSVFAEEFNISVKATASASEVTIGNEVTVNVYLTTNKLVDHCTFSVSADDTLSYKEMKTGIWSLLETTSSEYSFKNNSDVGSSVSDDFVFGISYVVNGDGKVTIKTVGCTSAANGDASYEATYQDVFVEIKSRDITKDTTLKTLNPIGGTFEEAFESQKYGDYKLILTSPNFGFEIEANNPNYQDKIVVKHNDNVISDYSKIVFDGGVGQGQMPITITVNNETSYRVWAYYEGDVLDNSLKYIKVDGKEINLIDGKYNYEITVSKDVTSFLVESELNDSENFMFDKDSGNGPGEFSIKDTVDVEIVVASKTGEVDSVTYKIVVTRVSEEEPPVVEPEPEPEPKPDPGSSSGGSNGGGSENIDDDPDTGESSMYIMAFVLVASLVGSIILYQRNVKGYE